MRASLRRRLGDQVCFSLIGTQRPHATVVVGYNTGQIRVFSEMGEPLVTETLHYAPVCTHICATLFPACLAMSSFRGRIHSPVLFLM